MKKHFPGLMLLLLLTLCGAFASLYWGGSSDVTGGAGDTVFWLIRVPKTITAICAGAALSVSGMILQTIFRNPLAGPYVLGISSGASLVVALMLLGGGFWMGYSELVGRITLAMGAIAGSLVVTLIVLGISIKVRSHVTLLLAGLMFGQVLGAIEGGLSYFADPGQLKSFVVWGLGSLSNTSQLDVMLFISITMIGIVLCIIMIKPLDAMLMGEDYARNAGIDVKKSRTTLIVISSILAGVTTAFCGPVAFVGIAVPVLSRLLFRTSSQAVQMSGSILIGSCMLLFADVIAHKVAGDTVLPVNMITTLIGAPIVITMLFKRKAWQ